MAITLRLPKQLHDDLHRIAEREYRTLTAQITLVLNKAVEEDRRQQEPMTAPDGEESRTAG